MPLRYYLRGYIRVERNSQGNSIIKIYKVCTYLVILSEHGFASI